MWIERTVSSWVDDTALTTLEHHWTGLCVEWKLVKRHWTRQRRRHPQHTTQRTHIKPNSSNSIKRLKKEKEEYWYSAILADTMHTHKALRHGSHSFTCREPQFYLLPAAPAPIPTCGYLFPSAFGMRRLRISYSAHGRGAIRRRHLANVDKIIINLQYNCTRRWRGGAIGRASDLWFTGCWFESWMDTIA